MWTDWPKKWTDAGLVGVTLKGIGLRIQLGHKPSDFCPAPILDNDFIVLDAYGLHEVAVNYCGCNAAPSRGRQLREARLYPNGEAAPHSVVSYNLAELLDAGAAPISMRARRARTTPHHRD